MKVIFRVDSSHQIGTGHLMRCLRFAEVLRSMHHDAIFVSRNLHGNISEQVLSRQFRLIALPPPEFLEISVPSDDLYTNWLGISIKSEIDQFSRILAREGCVDVVVVDHYGLDFKWEAAVKSQVPKVIVIDDLANRRHACDLIIDQNYYGRDNSRYNALVPTSCQKLVGAQYALIDRGYAEAGRNASVRTSVRHVFCYFGGVDATDEISKLLQAISSSNRLKEISFHISVGLANPRAQKIAQAAAAFSNVQIYSFIPNLPEFLGKMDLSIGAGGSTLWEKACVGLPSIAISVAENQVEVCNALSRDGYIEYLGCSQDVGAGAIRLCLEKYVDNGALLSSHSIKIRDLTDGRGIDRVISEAHLN